MLSEGEDLAKLWEIFQARLCLVLKRTPLKPKAEERLFQSDIEAYRQGEELFVPALSSGSGTNEENATDTFLLEIWERFLRIEKEGPQGNLLRGPADTK